MSLRFVIHEHHATHLHYDFRLEIEGVLRSWAIPKGPSMNPSEKRLAVKVADHALSYIDFEGIIPDGSYGSGEVKIWDSGSYDMMEYKENKLSFFLNGKKVKGGFTLVRFKGSGKADEWLLIKQKDTFADYHWKLKQCT